MARPAEPPGPRPPGASAAVLGGILGLGGLLLSLGVALRSELLAGMLLILVAVLAAALAVRSLREGRAAGDRWAAAFVLLLALLEVAWAAHWMRPAVP